MGQRRLFKIRYVRFLWPLLKAMQPTRESTKKRGLPVALLKVMQHNRMLPPPAESS